MGGISFLKLDENREIWIKRVNDFEAGKLPQTTWAKNNNVNVSALKYWLKNLNTIQVICSDNPPTELEFANVSIAGELPSSSVVLEVNNIKLSIKDDYDEMLLLKVIKTLRKI